MLAAVTDGDDQAFCVGLWSTANRVEAFGQSLRNQMVLTLLERMSINMFVLTLAYRAQSSIEIRFSSLKDCVSCLCVLVCFMQANVKSVCLGGDDFVNSITVEINTHLL